MRRTVRRLMPSVTEVLLPVAACSDIFISQILLIPTNTLLEPSSVL